MDSSEINASDYEYFKHEFEILTGIQLDLYKEKQMKRRINTYIGRKRKNNYEEFLGFLGSDFDELKQFIDYITINVTEFFRTPAQWDVFEEEALSVLAKRSEKPLKIWSAACSTGEEAWSLAMSLRRYLEPDQFRILATDIDETVLEAAKKGIYSNKSIESLSQDIFDQFFIEENFGWRISDELRSCVEFRKLDLLKDTYPSAYDLIVCRNVLIYFTEEAKDKIYTQFQQSLKPGGYLFTGNTEQIIFYKKYDIKKIRNFLYQKN